MLKRLTVLLLIAVMVVTSGICVFADSIEGIDKTPPDLMDMVLRSDIESTEQFLVTIAKPDGDETTDNSSYVVCGTTGAENVRYVVSVYNSEKDIYQTPRSIQEGSQFLILFRKDASIAEASTGWLAGQLLDEKSVYVVANRFNTFGLFTKVVNLKEGTNKIKIVAYTESALKNPILGKNIQVNYFDVTYLSSSIKDRLLRSIIDITQFFKTLF